MVNSFFFSFLFENDYINVFFPYNIFNLQNLHFTTRAFTSINFINITQARCRITGGHTIHTPTEEILPSAGNEPTPFQN